MWTPSLRRFGTALVAMVTFSLASFPGTVKDLSVDSRPLSAMVEHEFDFRTRQDADLTGWALRQFERAGLVLPPLVLRFHDERQDCGGNFGLYRAGVPAQVEICGFNWDRFVVTAKKTLLHELGHAWTQYNLTDDARQQFLVLRDLDAWGDDGFPWREQGSEQAAEIIAWALIDEELHLGIGADDPDVLGRAYAQLTGSLPAMRHGDHQEG